MGIYGDTLIAGSFIYNEHSESKIVDDLELPPFQETSTGETQTVKHHVGIKRNQPGTVRGLLIVGVAF